MTHEQTHTIVDSLLEENRESETAEFKIGNLDPNMIGEDVSALSNMAALENKRYAYLVWRIDDATHKPVGSPLKPKDFRVGNEELLPWLLRLLNPEVELSFGIDEREDKNIYLLRIGAAKGNPTKFKNVAYCRSDSHTVPLSKHNDIERRLWEKMETSSAELKIVAGGLKEEEVFNLLDFSTYYSLLGLPTGGGKKDWLQRAIAEKFLMPTEEEGSYDLTALGALLFAKDITYFPLLVSHAPRLIRYAGNDRFSTLPQEEFREGYALSFEKIMQSLSHDVQSPDSFHNGIRTSEYAYPLLALREVVANSLIHQKIDANGQGPLIELFQNQMVVSNPGILLVDPRRIIDTPPISVNPLLARFMRRIGIGDEVASGFDKIEASLAEYHMPSASIEEVSGSVRVTLQNKRSFEDYTSEEKMRTLYYHTVLSYLSSGKATNSSLRERFGLSTKENYKVSRLFKTAVEKGYVKASGESSKRFTSYVPYWVSEENNPTF